MLKKFWIANGLILLAFMASACSATPTPVPPSPTPLASPTTLSTQVPTSEPTATLAPTPTLLPTVPLPAGSPTRAGNAPTATRTPTRAAVAATATPAQAGLFVSNLRIAPEPPVRGVDLEFYPTFLNNTGALQNKRWVVYIYRTDAPSRSTGETPRTNTGIPPGSSEQKTAVGWKLGPGGPCEYFFARVAYIDEQENKPVVFTQPNGKVFEKTFTICPP